MVEFQYFFCNVCTYDKRNFKSQSSSIFHYDRVSDGRMAHILVVNDFAKINTE